MIEARDGVLDHNSRDFAQNPALDEHLAAMAVRSLAAQPGRGHFIDCTRERKEMSAGMLLAVASNMAELWRDRLANEERVGVVLPAGLGSMLANLALALLDKTAVNLNFTASPRALRASMERAEVTTVISAGPMVEKLPDFPWPEHRIDLAEEREKLSKSRILLTRLKVSLLPLPTLMRSLGVPEKGGDREAAILFSSGSTGDPKGVVLTHRNIVGNCLQIRECRLLEPHQTMLAYLPTFHSFGFTVTLWYPLTHVLKTVMLPSPLETRRIADTVETEKVTILLGTPTFFRPYFQRVEPSKLASLQFVVAGAEKTPKGFGDRWETQFGSAYLEGYGLTETTPVVSVNLPQREQLEPERRAGSVGRLFPGMTARVVRASDGEALPFGEQGILELRGPNVFNGYLKDEAATERVFFDEWFRTGDLARLDEDGYLYIDGRISRFSKIGGEMVPHGTIEHHINEAFELVESETPQVAVTGIADPQKGETLVVLSTFDLTPRALRERLAPLGLPNLWIPRQIYRVEAIPCLASGKLDLKSLAELAEEKAGGHKED